MESKPTKKKIIFMEMIRQIIIPQNSIVTMQLPEEMVGKTIELTALEIEEPNNSRLVSAREARLQQIEELTASSLVDLSKFKFNRDEANNFLSKRLIL